MTVDHDFYKNTPRDLRTFIEDNETIKDDQWYILKWIDMDEMYSRVDRPIIINNIQRTEVGDSAAINDVLFRQNKGEDIGFVASCPCKHLDQNEYIGSICPVCGGEVENNFVEHLQHKVWISVPDGIKAFLHPMMYFMLRKWLKFKGWEPYIDAILNINGELPPEVNEHIPGRGFNYFYDHFDDIIHYFMYTNPKTKIKKVVPAIKLILMKYRKLIFCTKLPIMSNQLHPMTQKSKNRFYTDTEAHDILSAALDIVSLKVSSSVINVSEARTERVTLNAYKSFISYVHGIINRRLAKKPGHLRKHTFGTRLHATYRAVITPICIPHEIDEIHIPWKIGVNTYKSHILNRLRANGDTFNTAVGKVYRALVCYSFEIDQILQDLLKNCRFKDPIIKRVIRPGGWPTVSNRNPSLSSSNLTKVRATVIKPALTTKPADERLVDIQDYTIGLSPLSLKLYNADFDGDNMNFYVFMEIALSAYFDSLHPSTHMMSYKDPEVSSIISLPTQHLVMLNNFLICKDPTI